MFGPKPLYYIVKNDDMEVHDVDLETAIKKWREQGGPDDDAQTIPVHQFRIPGLLLLTPTK